MKNQSGVKMMLMITALTVDMVGLSLLVPSWHNLRPLVQRLDGEKQIHSFTFVY